MQARDHVRQPFVIFGQPAEPCCPGEGALYHPAAWQQHEAALGLLQLDDFQADALRGGSGRWLARRCSPDRRSPPPPCAPSPPAPPRPAPPPVPDPGRWLESPAGPAPRRGYRPPGGSCCRCAACTHRSPPDARSPASIAAWRCRRSRPSAGRYGRLPSAASPADRAPSLQSSRPPASAGSADRPPPTVASRPGR